MDREKIDVTKPNTFNSTIEMVLSAYHSQFNKSYSIRVFSLFSDGIFIICLFQFFSYSQKIRLFKNFSPKTEHIARNEKRIGIEAMDSDHNTNIYLSNQHVNTMINDESVKKMISGQRIF